MCLPLDYSAISSGFMLLCANETWCSQMSLVMLTLAVQVPTSAAAIGKDTWGKEPADAQGHQQALRNNRGPRIRCVMASASTTIYPLTHSRLFPGAWQTQFTPLTRNENPETAQVMERVCKTSLSQLLFPGPLLGWDTWDQGASPSINHTRNFMPMSPC